MPIVGGLDIHRKQITVDYLHAETGRCGVERRPVPGRPPSRSRKPVFLAGKASRPT